jgi:hypothetical protein
VTDAHVRVWERSLESAKIARALLIDARYRLQEARSTPADLGFNAGLIANAERAIALAEMQLAKPRTVEGPLRVIKQECA